MRITRIILKAVFVIFGVVLTAYNSWSMYKSYNTVTETRPIKAGVYNVVIYAVNKDTIPALITDTLRWQDVIFESSGMGSMKTSDTSFTHNYNRAYFIYTTDTVQHFLNIKRSMNDSNFMLSMKYEMPDTNTIKLYGRQNTDSLYVLLKRSTHHFQLAERQFHWLSEHNR